MKDHVQCSLTVSLYELEGPPSEVSARLLRQLPDDAIDPRFHVEQDYEYTEGKLTWWRPMTEKELEKAKARRRAEKAAKEAQERAMLAKLKAKYDA